MTAKNPKPLTRHPAGTHRPWCSYNPGQRADPIPLPHSLSWGCAESDPCHSYLFNRIKVPEKPDLTPIFKGCIADGTYSTTITFFHHRKTAYKIVNYFITASAGFLGALELWQFLKWRYAGIHSRFEISLFSGLWSMWCITQSQGIGPLWCSHVTRCNESLIYFLDRESYRLR